MKKTIRLSAYNANKWSICPGSIFLEKDTEDKFLYRPKLESADLGKLMHKISENQLLFFREHNKFESLTKALRTEKVNNKHIEYDRIKNTVSFYINTIKKSLTWHKKIKGVTKFLLEDKNIYHFDSNDSKFKHLELVKNLKYNFRLVAKADALICTVDKVHKIMYLDVFDLKTGNFDYHDTALNQLKFTACIFILNHFSDLRYTFKINLNIVQPYYFNIDRKYVFYELIYIDIVEIIIELTALLNLINTNPNNYKYNDSCIFCPCILVCPCVEQIKDLLTTMININGVTSKNLNIDIFEILLDSKKLIGTYFKAIEEMLTKHLQEGKGLKNWMMGISYGHRKWTDIKTVEKVLKHLGGDRYNIALKNPAQMEKIAGKENIKNLTYKIEKSKLVKRQSAFDKVEV